MRLFIGLPLPPAVRYSLREKGLELKENTSRCRLTAVENFHLTLRFLGETPPQALDVLERVLLVTAKNTHAFPLTISGWGSFPRGNEAIVWAGVSQGQAPLEQLYQELGKNLAKAGFPREPRPYHPHITIARQARLQADLGHFSPIEEQVSIDTIALYHSHRDDKNKLVYEVLKQQPLSATS